MLWWFSTISFYVFGYRYLVKSRSLECKNFGKIHVHKLPTEYNIFNFHKKWKPKYFLYTNISFESQFKSCRPLNLQSSSLKICRNNVKKDRLTSMLKMLAPTGDKLLYLFEMFKLLHQIFESSVEEKDGLFDFCSDRFYCGLYQEVWAIVQYFMMFLILLQIGKELLN